MKWEKFKEKKEKELEVAIKKNHVDVPIKKLLKIINKNKNWVTTSSCSGRIVLLSIQEGKKDADFYKKWHGKVKAEEVELAIVHYDEKKPLWFRCEPFILHIATKNMKSAKDFLDNVRRKGVKRGGIQTITDKKVMVEIQGNGQIIIPIDYVDGKWNKIIELANDMLEKNFKHLKKLEKN